VILDPVAGAAVLVIGVDVVIVDVQTSQHRGPGWAAHGGGSVTMLIFGSSGSNVLLQLWHELQRSKLHILVISYNEDDVGSLG